MTIVVVVVVGIVVGVVVGVVVLVLVVVVVVEVVVVTGKFESEKICCGSCEVGVDIVRKPI